ncbi:histidinol-phosphatase HisJ [Bacillus sp. FJAT-45350]|uniref:histidinol-phosphatase HisJ n=1 Tax=Bacillus sp. FJAT-45350 TaxID=2011014 RepID=UPI000BB72D77|nr:histidinol-phosphatase HisJ [Bacillus sp. FJAT-45350]
MITHDGHIHTPYCPHGTKDEMNLYAEQAIKKGLHSITFAEHAPLPKGFIDPTPLQDSAMSLKNLYPYLEEAHNLKGTYKGKLNILVGLEVDFIEEYEKETTELLNDVGHLLDDSILSVHFLKRKNSYYCLDYSPDTFAEMIDEWGSVESVYRKYYETLMQSLLADLGPYKPKRVGHMTLVHKFQKKFPSSYNFNKEIVDILETISNNKMELDYNSAGVMKPLCGEPYPSESIVNKAINKGIPLVYGSDAHNAKGILQGVEKIKQDVTFKK